jgi:quinol monooxygenase YgiN
MVINVITYTFANDDADRVAAILRELRDATRLEPGCVRYDVARSLESPNVFVLFEEYVDESALERHLASEAFHRLGIDGIRKLAEERVYHKCRPLD